MTPSLTINSDAIEILGTDEKDLPGFFHAAVEEHERTMDAKGLGVLKDAPESAITLIQVPGFPTICVKEFRPRGMRHALKGLFRPTKARRSFTNGRLLAEAGVGVAVPLAMLGYNRSIVNRSEWVVMQVIPGAMELDRYLVGRIRSGWAFREKRTLIRSFARFIRGLHLGGIFHSDLKTCNILVLDGAKIGFALLDYDDVVFNRSIPLKRKVKNLVQIFLSTPIAIDAPDRMRFLREYSRDTDLEGLTRTAIARGVLKSASGRNILYVGPEGDIGEDWE